MLACTENAVPPMPNTSESMIPANRTIRRILPFVKAKYAILLKNKPQLSSYIERPRDGSF